MSTAVLMYHGVGDPAPFGEAHYTFGEEAFDRHLHLLGQGRVVSLDALLEGRAPPGSVVLTFDDGERSVAQRALPLMKARNMVGTLFVTTGWIGTKGYVEGDDLGLLAQEGWTIGTHGVTHRFLSDLGHADLSQELVQSRDALTRILGQPPLHMSLPGGREDHRVLQQVREAGYRSLCTSTVGVNSSPVPDPFRIRRAMMIRSFDEAALGRIIDGDRWFYLTLQTRQRALGLAKRAMGNQRYEQLRALAFGALQRLRRR